jgi:hypothetical protein
MGGGYEGSVTKPKSVFEFPEKYLLAFGVG